MKLKTLTQLCLLFLLSVFAADAQAQNKQASPIGVWTNEDKEARFEIYSCGKDQLCGKLVWLKEPTLDGKPKTDRNNPTAANRSRPLQGLVFLEGFKPVGDNKWDNGTIYDPKSGKTYSSYMKLLDRNKLEVKGYIGISLIGRSQTWTRVQ